MANGLKPLAGLCALYFVCAGCGSDGDAHTSSTAGSASASASGGAAGAPSNAGGAGSKASGSAGEAALAGASAAGGKSSGGGSTNAAGSAGQASAGAGGGPPPAVDGRSIYALECHGDSKDCHLGTVPCFGVSSPTPNVAAGWACANRCTESADCSSAPSGAEAKASCVAFSSSGHCMLVCQNENRAFACPDGMSCYTPPKSPIGYCLWQ